MAAEIVKSCTKAVRLDGRSAKRRAVRSCYIPTPVDAMVKLVRTYAKNVLSDAKWSLATLPEFSRVKAGFHEPNKEPLCLANDFFFDFGSLDGMHSHVSTVSCLDIGGRASGSLVDAGDEERVLCAVSLSISCALGVGLWKGVDGGARCPQANSVGVLPLIGFPATMAVVKTSCWLRTMCWLQFLEAPWVNLEFAESRQTIPNSRGCFESDKDVKGP